MSSLTLVFRECEVFILLKSTDSVTSIFSHVSRVPECVSASNATDSRAVCCSAESQVIFIVDVNLLTYERSKVV